MIFLNTDTFVWNMGHDVPRLQTLKATMTAAGGRTLSVLPTCLEKVREVCKAGGGAFGESYFRAHFMPPYSPARSMSPTVYSRYASHTYTVATPAGRALPAPVAGLASLLGGISIGLSETIYGDQLERDVDETPLSGGVATAFKGLLLTLPEHAKDDDWRRWNYAMTYPASLGAKGIVLPTDLWKHFGREAFPRSPVSVWRKESWVADTGKTPTQRNKLLGNATFLPGFKHRGPGYRKLVCDVLQAAYEHQQYTEAQQKTFTLDIGTPVGAAKGKVTTSLKLYLTTGNVIHVRPYEKRGTFRKAIQLEFD